MNERPVGQQQLFRVLALSLLIALLGGSIALLSQWHQSTANSHAASSASSDSVVGPPSLPASFVDSIFRRLGSPMAGTGQAVEAASRAAHIDDAFALAVWTETNDGAAGVGLADRNPGSVRGSVGYPSAYDGYTIYPSYTAAVNYWFPMLQKVYINRGLTTVTAISHPYVGTSTSYLWAGKVINLMNRYRAEAPPPPPPTPTPSAKMKIVAHTIQQQDQNWSTPKSTAQPPKKTQTAAQKNAQASGLSASAERLLLLINLLLALALTLWALILKRKAVSVPKPAVQPVGNVWEQLQASNQQPAAFFRQQSLAGLRITEALTDKLPSTGQLVANTPGAGLLSAQAQQTSQSLPNTPRSGLFAAPALGNSLFAASTRQTDNFTANLSSAESFTTSSSQFGNFAAHTPETSLFTASLSSSAETFAASNSRQFTQSGFGVPSSPQSFAPNQPSALPGFGNQFSPIHTEQLSFDAPLPAYTEQLPFDAAIAALSGKHSSYAPAPSPSASRPGAEQTYAPAPNTPYRAFQPSQPASSNPWQPAEPQQSQLVGAGAGSGRSNGLLSRYREMQAQGQR
jgi:hypothetical protein